MFCAISGEIPQIPVVSRTTGLLYEKSLIEKSLAVEGKCPVTGLAIDEQDLIAVKSSKMVRPKPVSHNSFPSLLATIQNEWDEMALETFTLRQHLDATRRELSQALYQHDAACRVIARLMRERDEAKGMLAALQANGYTPAPTATKAPEPEPTAADTKMDIEPAPSSCTSNSIDEVVLNEIGNKCKELSQGRKGRKPGPDVRTKEQLASFELLQSYTSHKADKSMQGVTSLAIKENYTAGAVANQTVLLSGGVDKTAALTDKDSGKIVGKLTGHSKKVNTVHFHPNADSAVAFTGSADKTVKVWSVSSSSKKATGVAYDCEWTYTGHDAEVACLTVHPTGNYVVSADANNTWHFLDVARQQRLAVVNDTNGAGGCYFHACAFHPDGLILGTGTSTGRLGVWDVRVLQIVANCEGHTGAIGSVCFSENGYHVATSSADGLVKLWDLRKQACLKDMEVGATLTSSVRFDDSALYLAVAGVRGEAADTSVSVYAVKEWAKVTDLPSSHSKAVTAVVWGSNASYLATSSLDRSVKVFGSK